MPGDTGAGAATWTAAYLRTRELEGRLYDDRSVARLPEVPVDHPHRAEWRCRADSLARLLAYLERLPGPISVLEAGCGNGWLAARIAERLAAGDRSAGSRVVGLDVNARELDQARRVFADRPNLRFLLADVLSADPPAAAPDVIVLASVIQYVPDLAGLAQRLAGWLAPGGEIHVLDSPLYAPEALDAARRRTADHYAALGLPEMSEVYRHHGKDELAGFPARLLYDPASPSHRLERRLLGRPRSPFPWLRLGPFPGRPS